MHDTYSSRFLVPETAGSALAPKDCARGETAGDSGLPLFSGDAGPAHDVVAIDRGAK
jgi:hypothetical protein